MSDILFCTFYILLLSFIIVRTDFFTLPAFKPFHTLLLFYLKLLAGLGLWFLYSHLSPNRYTSDIFKYYDDAGLMYNCIHHHPADFIKMICGIDDSGLRIRTVYGQMNSWANGYGSALYNNSHFIIRLNALFMLLSQGHYGVHVIFMCFISLTGLVFIYKRFYPPLSRKPFLLLASVFLFPSVLLWGSGILKEALVFLGLGASIFYFYKLINNHGNPVKNAILVLLALILILENKAYVAFCLLPCLLSEFAVHRIALCRKHIALTYAAVTALYLFAGMNISRLGVPVNPMGMLAAKQTDFNRIANGGLYLQASRDSNLYALLPSGDTAQLVAANPFSDSIRQNKGIKYLSSPSFIRSGRSAHRFALFTIKPGAAFKRFRANTSDTAYQTAGDTGRYHIFIYSAPAKSRILTEAIKTSLSGLAAQVPQALALTLIRPLPGEIHSATALLEFAENVLLWLLLLGTVAIPYLRRPATGASTQAAPHPQVSPAALCLTFTLLMLTLIGLVTPLYGGIERYRCLAMPFLIILLLLFYDKRTRT